MKVLLVADNFRKGGIERQILELLRGLKEDPGIRLELLIMGGVMTYPQVYELADEVHLLKRVVKKDPFMFFRVFQFLKQNRPDVVHSWGGMSSVYLTPSVKLLGIPFINGIIRDAPKWKHNFQPKLLRAQLTFPFSDVVLGNSQAGLDSFKAPKSKSRVVLNGINLNRMKDLEDPKVIRERFHVKTDQVVGMVGGFNYRKDYATFLKAAELVLAEKPDVTFLPIGGGDTLEPLRSTIKAEFKDRILFPGAQQDVESIVNIFDIGVLATNANVHLEGISNSIMEYMMLSKPVIATDGGGTPEIVVDGETGYVIPPYDTQALANKILYLLEHPELARDMGLKGRRRIETAFALDKMVHTYNELYHRLGPVPTSNLSESA